MKRLLLIPVAILIVAVAIAGCGGGSDGSSGSAAAATTGTVNVKSVDGAGDVLVDSKGMALYTSNREASGKVVCRGACTSIWMPLTAGSGKPTGAPGAGKLGVVTRPDGAKQVTVAGKPVYTFAEDTAGQVNGNGVSDQFGVRKFTWTAVLANGKAASTSDGGSGGGDSTGGRGYGY